MATLNSEFGGLIRMSFKVNIGCGDTALSGWENLDNSYGIIVARYPRVGGWLSSAGFVNRDWWSRWSGKDIRRVDARKGLPFPTGSADYVYTSHLLEHFTRPEAEELLRECLRILNAEGLLRVVTPDLEHLFYMYNSLKENFDRNNPEGNVPGDHFVRCLGIVSDYSCEDHRAALRLLRWRQEKHSHRWIYDFDSLYVMLRRVGFKAIKRLGAGEGEMADLDRLEDNYPYPNSLFIEARPQ